MAAPTKTVESALEPASASGARIDHIEPAEAARLVERLGEVMPAHTDLVWGAREDDGSLIGVAALAISGDAMVAVVPARRRLKVGGDLLHLLVEHARLNELRYVGCSRREASEIPAAFLRSLGLVVSRRTAGGAQRIVAIIPPKPEFADSAVSPSRPGRTERSS